MRWTEPKYWNSYVRYRYADGKYEGFINHRKSENDQWIWYVYREDLLADKGAEDLLYRAKWEAEQAIKRLKER